jgi:galactosylceramidase
MMIMRKTDMGKSMLRSLLFLLLTIVAARQAAGQDKEAKQVVIDLDEHDAGRRFEGIGGVSAGASSELLIDYPEPQRKEILDYLFKPGFGASLQQLKVEIGADVCVVGAEASHARNLQELRFPKRSYYERGYEYWMMQEAQRRNPDMIFCALEWGIPAYLTGFWTQENADYITRFIRGARDFLGIRMEYISPGKNESTIDPGWLRDILKPTLVKAGLGQVKILAPDDNARYWTFCKTLGQDPRLASMVNAVGYHYVYGHLPRMDNEEHPVPEDAKKLGVSLWASEDWSMYDGSWENAHILAGILNKMYIRDRITAMEIWCPIDGYYDNTGEYHSTGLFQADQPWSGHYQLMPAVWAVAHFTQFTRPGWKYIDGGCNYFDKPSGGNYSTLYDSATGDFSTIVYADSSTRAQLLIRPQGRLAKPFVYVWKSDEAQQFRLVGKVALANGSYPVLIEPGCIYTISSTTGQQKGTVASEKPAAPFPIPYEEDFSGLPDGKNPRFFADIEGAFETETDPVTKNKLLTQQITDPPINWTYAGGFKPLGPLTELGDVSWRDYSVAVDVRIGRKGYGQIIARMNGLREYTEGYVLKLYHNGYWELLLNSHLILASGRIATKVGAWHRLKLDCRGDHIEALIDGKSLARVTDNQAKAGMVGLGCSWDRVQFDRLSIER